MAIDGNWEITINSPMGAQKAKLELQAKDGALTGTQHAQGSSQPVANGKADGNNVSWSANITSPMPMTLEFEAKVDGDTMSGNVKLGAGGIREVEFIAQIFQMIRGGQIRALQLKGTQETLLKLQELDILDSETAAGLLAESLEQQKLIRTPNQVEAVMSNLQKRVANYRD